MKRIRAYGGTAILHNLGNGWSYEYWKHRTYTPPLRRNFSGGAQFYIFKDGTHGMGTTDKLANARRHAVNALKASPL